MCVCVCVCVCVCMCDYFFHFVSCSVFLIDLVTSVLLPVLSCQSCLQNVKKKKKKKKKNCHYYSFFTPHILVIIMIIIIIICRLKESCNFLASVPGLPCAQKVEEKEEEKTRNKFFRSNLNSSKANTIPNSQCNINFGWWLAFILFCLDEQIYYKKKKHGS